MNEVSRRSTFPTQMAGRRVGDSTVRGFFFALSYSLLL